MIEIELLQNPFVDVWFNAFIKNFDVPRWQYAGNLFQHKGAYTPPDRYWIDQINLAIDEIERISEVEWIDRAYLGMGWSDINRLHRGFTTSVVTDGLTPELPTDVKKKIKQLKQTQLVCHYDLQDFIREQDLPDYYNLGKKKEIVWYDFHSALQKLNSSIHRYEGEFLKSDRAWDLTGPPYSLTIDLKDKYYDGKYMNPVHTEKVTTDLMQHAFNGYEYNVYAEKKILGKDYHTAYFQYDDPTEWDITNNMDFDGSIHIDYNGTYQTIHESRGFCEWLQHYGINNPYKYSYYQIGKLVENQFLNDIREFQLTNIKNPENIDEPHAIDPVWNIEYIEVIE